MTEVATPASVWAFAVLGFIGGALLAAGGVLLLIRRVRQADDARPYPRPIARLLPHAVKIAVAGGVLVLLGYGGLILSAARLFSRP